MADVTGPVTTLPGSYHRSPIGMMCDNHPTRPALIRIQGETDSMGAEMIDVCDECYKAYKDAQIALARELQHCDWCGEMKQYVHPHRDYEEGSVGRVYQVCNDCRVKETARITEDLGDEEFE